MLRGFTDSSGVEWRVWEVYPLTANETLTAALTSLSLKNTTFAEGWLCFESSFEKRRLAPIPRGWEFRDPAVLEELRDQATPVRLRNSPRPAPTSA
jgi:hypothetical protein